MAALADRRTAPMYYSRLVFTENVMYNTHDACLPYVTQSLTPFDNWVSHAVNIIHTASSHRTCTSRVLCRNVDQRNELPVLELVHPGEHEDTRVARVYRTSWRRRWWRQASASFSPPMTSRTMTSFPAVCQTHSTSDDFDDAFLQSLPAHARHHDVINCCSFTQQWPQLPTLSRACMHWKLNIFNKLSCRREAARCFVSLKILINHSGSSKVIQNYPDKYGVVLLYTVFQKNMWPRFRW